MKLEEVPGQRPMDLAAQVVAIELITLKKEVADLCKKVDSVLEFLTTNVEEAPPKAKISK